MEDYAYVLDVSISPDGRGTAYLLGVNRFTLLLGSIKRDRTAKIGEKYYIGKDKDKRDVIEMIKERITFQDLTEGARMNMKDVLKKIVMEREAEYVTFLNNAKAINARTHTLEFLPHIGKKTLKVVLEKRPYNSFKDLYEKTGLDGVEIFAEKIYRELSGKDIVKILTIII
ncbi:MAG: DUF655 domain-containing protein [Candidatus Micrarchaeota archaeon]|nr:DUF655 domain-containing protein [Candidatus Micrarchaeota archaeon]MCX8154345.1 DUF655 domain-containing protein [Candidatus Micrarchaeota archaeon]